MPYPWVPTAAKNGPAEASPGDPVWFLHLGNKASDSEPSLAALPTPHPGCAGAGSCNWEPEPRPKLWQTAQTPSAQGQMPTA